MFNQLNNIKPFSPRPAKTGLTSDNITRQGPLGGKGLIRPTVAFFSLTLSLPERPKPSSLLFYCLTPYDFIC